MGEINRKVAVERLRIHFYQNRDRKQKRYHRHFFKECSLARASHAAFCMITPRRSDHKPALKRPGLFVFTFVLACWTTKPTAEKNSCLFLPCMDACSGLFSDPSHSRAPLINTRQQGKYAKYMLITAMKMIGLMVALAWLGPVRSTARPWRHRCNVWACASQSQPLRRESGRR